MSHIYRSIRGQALQALNGWMVIVEIALGRGKGSSRKLVVAALSLTAGLAQAAPIGGQVVSGAGSVEQLGATTTIHQATQNLSLNWQSFNIAPQETVNFVQPSASAVAVNRIFDTNGSQILGRLNANGQVYLVNPNGVLFGQGAQVNVGALVASTLDFNDASLKGATRSFSGKGAGSIVNQGIINAASGGYVALLGNTVANTGAINAPLGTVALGAGNAVTLNFNGDSLVSLQIDQSVLNSLVENGGLIKADGGKVFMNAGAKDSLLASVVNNTGVIEARTLENRDGTIILLAGMTAGTTQVSGTLDASAPNGGDGGFIETSAAHVKVADAAKVSTLAPAGKTGKWLIDPTDYTIAATGGDMTGLQLSTSLGTTDVIVQSAAMVQGQGDIFINDAVKWSTGTKLTLIASRNIAINADITNDSITAAVGSLSFKYGQGDIAEGNAARNTLKAGTVITLRGGSNYSTTLGSDGVQKDFTVLTRVGSETSTDGKLFLQGLSTAANLAGNYVLGSDLNAFLTSDFNGGAGFMPIGTPTAPFTGSFDGFGHTISYLTINRPALIGVGLFGAASASAVISNVGLLNATIKGAGSTGGLVGVNAAKITNSNVNGSVVGGAGVGGLVGSNTGRIQDSYSAATVTNSGAAIGTGGLVGSNAAGAKILNSYATGAVKGGPSTGGLVGANASDLSGVYATGDVAGAASSGGLVGDNAAGSSVSNSHATGSVTGAASTGGLVGTNGAGVDISNSYATGNVSNGISANIGGLVGSSTTGNISGSYAIGNVEGGAGAGGLLGSNTTGNITNSYAKGDITGGAGTGGLAGSNTTGNITNTYAFGKILSNAAGTGPLFGSSTTGVIKSSYFDSAKNPSPTFTQFGTGIDPATAMQANYVGFSSGIWAFPAGSAPILKALITTVTVSAAANNVIRIYDGQTFSGGNGVAYSVSSPDPTTYLTGTLTYGGNSQGAKNAGTYVITPGGLTTSNAQYVLAYVNGTLTITKADLVVTGLTTAAKTYNADTRAVLGGTAAVTGMVSGDIVTVGGTAAGSFATKNVGNALAVTVSGNELRGTDAGNYNLVQQTGLTADVLKANLVVNGITIANKVYDGTTAATVSGNAVVTALGNDQVSVAGGTGTATFVDKNVGLAKAVTIAGFTLSGADAGNYNTSGTSTGTAAISRLGAVVWSGGATGNWFDPANWAGGAVPDLSNVANVVIPTGVNVSFNNGSVVIPAQAGPVNVDSIGGAGALTLSAGDLNVASSLQLAALSQSGGSLGGTGNVTADTFSQTGGTVANAGNFTVARSFAQSAPGTVAVGGNVGITQISGPLVVSSLSGNNVTLAASSGTASLGAVTANGTLGVSASGDITQTGPIAATGVATLASTTGDITLSNPANDFKNTVSVSGKNIALADANSMVLGNVNATGTLGINAAGNIAQVTGTSVVATGASTLASTTGDILLGNLTNDFSTVDATGKNITVADANGIVLSQVIATGALGVTAATGNITQTGPIAATGLTTLAATTGNIALANPANNFGTVDATARDITLADANALTAVVHASGNTTLVAGGNLGVSGTTNNLITTTTNGGATNFATTTVAGDLAVNSSGSASQAGALAVGGTPTITVGGVVVSPSTGVLIITKSIPVPRNTPSGLLQNVIPQVQSGFGSWMQGLSADPAESIFTALSATTSGGSANVDEDVTTTTLAMDLTLKVAAGGMRLPKNMVDTKKADGRREKLQ